MTEIEEKKRRKRWEGLLVVLRLGCIEVHGRLEKTHCFPIIFKLTVKATGDLCLKKLVIINLIVFFFFFLSIFRFSDCLKKANYLIQMMDL